MLENGFSPADALRAHTCVLSFPLGSVGVEGVLTTTAGDDVVAKRLSQRSTLWESYEVSERTST
jgi:hypothetical protein